MSEWRTQIDAINRDLQDMRITWTGVPRMVLDLITDENADNVISSLTGPARESFLAWARDLSSSDDDEMISFDTPDGKPTAERKDKFRIVRSWVAAHPLLERADAFPMVLVEELAARVDVENYRLIELVRTNREHPERARSNRAMSVATDLLNALRVATKEPANPQAQAFAWEWLDRALRNVEGIIELTEDEQRLVNCAKRTAEDVDAPRGEST